MVVFWDWRLKSRKSMVIFEDQRSAAGHRWLFPILEGHGGCSKFGCDCREFLISCGNLQIFETVDNNDCHQKTYGKMARNMPF